MGRRDSAIVMATLRLLVAHYRSPFPRVRILHELNELIPVA